MFGRPNPAFSSHLGGRPQWMQGPFTSTRAPSTVFSPIRNINIITINYVVRRGPVPLERRALAWSMDPPGSLPGSSGCFSPESRGHISGLLSPTLGSHGGYNTAVTEKFPMQYIYGWLNHSPSVQRRRKLISVCFFLAGVLLSLSTDKAPILL